MWYVCVRARARTHKRALSGVSLIQGDSAFPKNTIGDQIKNLVKGIVYLFFNFYSVGFHRSPNKYHRLLLLLYLPTRT